MKLQVAISRFFIDLNNALIEIELERGGLI